MDVKFIMIMTIFEWNLDFLLILATDVWFLKLKKGKSSEFRWESIFGDVMSTTGILNGLI